MKKIVFLGDSLTFGENNSLISKHGMGYSFVDILIEKHIGTFNIIKEGQCGRYTNTDDEDKYGRNGLKVLEIILRSNFSIDYIFIMLGTNDLKNWLAMNEYDIANQFIKYSELIERFKNSKDFNYNHVKIILIASPKVNVNLMSDTFRDLFNGSQSKSNNLAKEYKNITEKLSWDYIDCSDVLVCEEDGIHLNDDGNEQVANIIDNYIKTKIQK